MSTQKLGLGNGRVFKRPLASLAPHTTLRSDEAWESLAQSKHGQLDNQFAETLNSINSRVAERARNSFRPLPVATGKSPFHLSLESVLASDDIQRISENNLLVFHTVGDIGAKKRPKWQKQVIQAMVADCERPTPRPAPSFLYIIGDVIYFKGEADEYYPQFYEAFEDYPGPIFAIPGNHDGEGLENGRSLDAFTRNFCAESPNLSPDAYDVQRDAMTQPNVYFTLDTPLATMIGLYSNVPEGGVIEDDQRHWFTKELKNASEDKALIVSVHHPLFSLDDHHSGSQEMLSVFEDSISQSGRTPDLILTAHVHNYQRFTWTVNGSEVPVIVAGAGGYPNLHKMKTISGHRIQTPYRQSGSHAVLERYVDHKHGYLRVEVSSESIKGKYYLINDSQNSSGDRVDTFSVDLATGALASS